MLRKKIKVCKTKTSLRISDNNTKSSNNTNIIKKKILKVKSEKDIKPKKKIRIMKIDSCTIEGKSFKQKYNQENFFMKTKFLNKNEQFLIGICNGHGKHGKLISKYIINELPEIIKDTSENEIINSYLQINKEILKQNNKAFDCSLSGASCISLIISLEKIISANLGDNKAILARYENDLYNYVNLNREHKPTLPDEKKRILEHNGKIGHLYEKSNNSPKKVYLKNSDIPGLPLSRSFGDVIAHSVGVISEPEVKYFSFNGNEKFIIMASHGFWDIINGEKSVEIVREFYDNNMDAIGALNKLALEILNKCENEKKIINEDIIIIIAFFE
jgi:serine/threonine protein phosphatase PrpC